MEIRWKIIIYSCMSPKKMKIIKTYKMKNNSNN